MKRRSLFELGAAAMLAGLPGAVDAASPPPAASGDVHQPDEPIRYVTPTGTLAGVVRVPVAITKPPIVSIVPGSGPVDRDGNGPGLDTDSYKLLADALETAGIASLRVDKRGVGQSGAAMSSESALRFETYVDDTSGWLGVLHADGRFGRTYIAGHSEGSLIGMLAAQRTPNAGFASLCGFAQPAADELARQLQPRLASAPELAAANARILASLRAGKIVADVPGPLDALYRPSVQPYLISWFRYDPVAEIAKLRLPVLVVGGTADLQVPIDDARALAKALPGARLDVIDGMSHTFKDASGMTPEQQQQTVYRNPSLKIVPELPTALAALVISAR